MKTAAMQYAVTITLAGALALTATARTYAQTRTGPEGGRSLAQYCAPPHYDTTDLHRIYCREPG